MKNQFLKALSLAVFLSGIGGIQSKTNAEEAVIIFLTEPDPKVDESIPADKEDIPSAQIPAKTSTPKKKTLDDLIKETKQEPLNKKQQRIVDGIKRDEKAFIQLLDQFVKVKFDPEDDEAIPEFRKIRDEIVAITFRAPDERTYYSRLYLINVVWLDNQTEVLRFASLDKKLQDKWQDIDEQRRHIQSMIMTGGAIAGLAIGGVLSYTAATRIFEIKADAGTLAKIAKWGGRIPIVLMGAYVGASAGRYLGFLGADVLMHAQRDFLNPIDGNEDLRDVLPLIEQLP